MWYQLLECLKVYGTIIYNYIHDHFFLNFSVFLGYKAHLWIFPNCHKTLNHEICCGLCGPIQLYILWQLQPRHSLILRNAHVRWLHGEGSAGRAGSWGERAWLTQSWGGTCCRTIETAELHLLWNGSSPDPGSKPTFAFLIGFVFLLKSLSSSVA